MSKNRISRVWAYRHTLWDMALASLKSKYSGSILGITWAFINPLLIVTAVTFVFSAVFKIEIKNFPLFALAGIFPWSFLSGALSEATFSLLGQQNILRQFSLPRGLIPLSSVLSNFLNFLIGWLVAYPLFLFFNPKIILLLPLLLLVLLLNLVFGCGLGMILAILNVFFRDTGHLLGVVLMFWFWITPVFYSPEMVPQQLRWAVNFNPATAYVVYYRQVIFHNNIPGFPTFAGVFFWAFASIILGFLVFSRLESKILKQL